MCTVTFWKEWLNVIGLFMGMIGVIIIFIWGPPQPSFEEGVNIGLEDGTPLPNGKTVGQTTQERKELKGFYTMMSRIGLAFVFLGFACQFGNEILRKLTGS